MPRMAKAHAGQYLYQEKTAFLRTCLALIDSEGE